MLLGMSPAWIPSSVSALVAQLKRFALNLARCSSSETACRNVLIDLLEEVKGNVRGIKPTEQTVSQTPTKSMSTSIENAFLKALLCFQPVSSVRENILYAKGTCCILSAGRRPTCQHVNFEPQPWSFEMTESILCKPCLPTHAQCKHPGKSRRRISCLLLGLICEDRVSFNSMIE